MKVSDILAKKGSSKISTIGPQDSIATAIRELSQYKIGALLVEDQEGRPVGIITERDLLQVADQDLQAEADKDLKRFGERVVAQVMSGDLICGLPEDNVQYVMQVMTQNRIRHLPIVEANRLVGLISIGDVVNSMLEAAQVENHMLKDYLHMRGDL